MDILIQGALLRAITDNMVHGSLAVIIWLLGYMSHVECRQSDVNSRHLGNGLAKHTVVILQSVACGVLSSAVDIDHFLAAGSFDLQVRIFNYSKTKLSQIARLVSRVNSSTDVIDKLGGGGG